MAEWRSRGYVADSDEEEDSQGSDLQSVGKAVQLPTSGDDIETASALRDGNAKFWTRDEAVEADERGTSSQKLDGTKTTTTQSTAEALEPTSDLGQNHGLTSPGTHGRRTLEKALISNHDEWDELQEGHDLQTPTLQPCFHMPGRTTRETSSAQPDLFQPHATHLLSNRLALSSTTPPDGLEGAIAPDPSPDGRGLEPASFDFELQHYQARCDSDELQVLTTAAQLPEGSRASRNLRHRNPIQLHPYAIESEKYRQVLKARGVKPLRLARMKDQVAPDEEDTQNMEYQMEETQLTGGDTERDHRESSPVLSQSSATTEQAGDMFAFRGDELPEVSDILDNPRRNWSKVGCKRQKIGPATFRLPRGICHAVRKSPPRAHEHAFNEYDELLFDLPASPPHSRSQTLPDIVLSTLSSPDKVMRNTLPTPITSSEPRRRPIQVLSEGRPSGKRFHDRDVFSSSDASSTESETPDQLQKAQRRMRGVLPASWLKLDLKARRPSAVQKDNQSPSPKIKRSQRGVARPVKGAREKTLELWNDALSEDEGEVFDQEVLHKTSSNERGVALHNIDDSGFLEERHGEAIESDQVDPMLPLLSRKRTHRQSKRNKRQAKLADLDLHDPSRVKTAKEKIQNHWLSQTKRTNTSDQRPNTKPRVRPPKLSILDVQSSGSLSSKQLPPFLKVAIRTVRSRNDKGRQSPYHKYLRLATRTDHEDANETLQDWRNGSIAPQLSRDTIPTEMRQPLHPRSYNSILSSPTDYAEKLKSSRPFAHQKTSSRSQKHPVRAPRFQSSLDYLIDRQIKEPSGILLGPQAQYRTKNAKKPRQLMSSVRKYDDSRPAMLETPRHPKDHSGMQTSFQRNLSRINHFEDGSGLPNVLRLFEDEKASRLHSPFARSNLVVSTSHHDKSSTGTNKHRNGRGPRKRRPQQVDASVSWTKPSSSRIDIDSGDNETQPSAAIQRGEQDLITGLGNFGTCYSDNFNVTPLLTRSYFQADTFIGSGAFARSLKIEKHAKLDQSRGHINLYFRETSFTWGPWNESVSSGLGEILTWINHTIKTLHSEGPVNFSNSPIDEALSLLTSIIAYFSDHLQFLDPIDRVSCVQRCKSIVADTLSQVDEAHASSELKKQVKLRFSILFAVLTNQVRQISRHELIPPNVQDESRTLAEKAIRQAFVFAVKDSSKLEGIVDGADHIIQDQEFVIQTITIGHHILSQMSHDSIDLWRIMGPDFSAPHLEGTLDVSSLEAPWKRLFTLLPILEIDDQGNMETGCRFKISFDNWGLVKKLLSPVLHASLNNSFGQAPNFNAYCRSLFARCLNLINSWGWRRCETIIGMLFDFFAHNNLANLRNEECHGSPPFLEHLAENPLLTLEPGDRCFHILLKIIGSGLRHMQGLYSRKKMRDVVWRLMPNHGRLYPKEEAVRQEDLDALRNHHDLVCTLYWAAPPDCRPNLAVIRNLVQVETSHREACHINIRAWFNLVKYQLSTSEPGHALESFTEWHNDIITQLIQQHNLARSEAEDQLRSIQRVDGMVIAKQHLEITIARNQRQVEATISDALVSLKLAIDSASDEETAAILLSPCLVKVFGMLDTENHRATKSAIQALEVLKAYICKSSFTQKSKPSDGNEDSQDYGDWPTFDDDDNALIERPNAGSQSALLGFSEPLRQFLSNCFGSDVTPDDSLLRILIDVWVGTAQALVRAGARSWADNIDRYGSGSWSSLRDTEQTRKWAAYYFSSLIEQAKEVYNDYKLIYMTSWIGLIVERESLLKHQHRLTEALINADHGHPILQNLPFCTNGTEQFEITATEFSERRLSLISTVLSNMRTSVESAVFEPTVNAMERRQEYKSLLKHMMANMKHNYQELGQGSNVRGAYVDFVHSVIELLQQHTSTIYPIDRFFTDNGAFPLPARDPTYVVGQLKNYSLRLQDTKTPNQLTVFLQSVSERAAVDNQQAYLVGQLHTAMSNAFEDGVSPTPNLRSFVIKATLPAYIEIACTPSGAHCGWILTMPYLLALQNCFGELLLDLDGANPASVAATTSIIGAFLGALRSAFAGLLSNSDLLRGAGILKLVSACYNSATALLPTLEYLVRLSDPTQCAVNDVEYLKDLAAYLTAYLGAENRESPQAPPDVNVEYANAEERSPFADTLAFAKHELKEILTRNWSYNSREQIYYVTRGSSRREVVADIGLFEEEKRDLLQALEEWRRMLVNMPALSDEDDERERELVLRGIGGVRDGVLMC